MKKDMKSSENPKNQNLILQPISRRSNAKIDLPKALEMHRKGISYADIAKYFNCSERAIHYAFQPYLKQQEDTEVFVSDRANILANLQRILLFSFTEADIKKMSAYQRIGMFSILYDKERLERNLSTENIDMHHKVSQLSEKLEKLASLRRRLEKRKKSTV